MLVEMDLFHALIVHLVRMPHIMHLQSVMIVATMNFNAWLGLLFVTKFKMDTIVPVRQPKSNVQRVKLEVGVMQRVTIV